MSRSSCTFSFSLIYLYKSLTTILLRDVQSYCLGFWETDSRPSNFIFRFDIVTAIAIFVSRFDTASAPWLLMIVNFAMAVVSAAVVYPSDPTMSFDLWTPNINFITLMM